MKMFRLEPIQPFFQFLTINIENVNDEYPDFVNFDSSDIVTLGTNILCSSNKNLMAFLLICRRGKR